VYISLDVNERYKRGSCP